MDDFLTVWAPDTKGLCCKITVKVTEDEVLTMELDAEAAEALALTLLGMVEAADMQSQDVKEVN